MAILVSDRCNIVVNAVDLSDHCIHVVVDDGQETREASAFGNAARVFRAGILTPSIEATFRIDDAASSVRATLQALILGTTSTGFTVLCRRTTGVIATTNPLYNQTSIIDGSLPLLNDDYGEIPELTVRFVPYSGVLTITTTATS